MLNEMICMVVCISKSIISPNAVYKQKITTDNIVFVLDHLLPVWINGYPASLADNYY